MGRDTLKRLCGVCAGSGSYWDRFFGQFYPCETCGGKGEMLTKKGFEKLKADQAYENWKRIDCI